MWTPQLFTNPDSTYENLISGKIPAIIIPDVISKLHCEKLCNKILTTQHMTSGPGISNKIGTSISSHIYEKSKYFSNAQKSNQKIQNIFSDVQSPLYLMQKTITDIFQKQISTATENSMSYSNAVIRIHQDRDSVHLHRDNSNFEMPEYSISHFENQLSAILYLQSPKKGGDLTIYQKIWHKEDEKLRQPEFGYSSEIVNNVQQTRILPISGTMVIINPKFYHQIESVSGVKQRISLGFFFGELSKSQLYSWA